MLAKGYKLLPKASHCNGFGALAAGLAVSPVKQLFYANVGMRRLPCV